MRGDGATLDSRSANDCQCRQTLTAAVSVGPRLLARRVVYLHRSGPRHLCPRWEFRRPVRGCAQRGGSRDPADMGGDGGVIGLDPNGEVVDLGIFQ